MVEAGALPKCTNCLYIKHSIYLSPLLLVSCYETRIFLRWAAEPCSYWASTTSSARAGHTTRRRDAPQTWRETCILRQHRDAESHVSVFTCMYVSQCLQDESQAENDRCSPPIMTRLTAEMHATINHSVSRSTLELGSEWTSEPVVHKNLRVFMHCAHF